MATDRSQLEIEQALNAVIAERSALMAKNKSELADQIALAQELCRALECRELDGFQERMAETKAGLLEVADASEDVASGTQDVNKAMKKATKTSFSWKAAGVGAFVAVKNAASNVFGILGSIGSLMTSMVSGAFNIVKLGLQAYNGMIDGLLQKGQELHNGTSEIRQQMEALRAQFGALHKGEGAALMKSWDQLNARGQKFSGTGLRMARVFGSGPGGTAKMMELLQERATEMGPIFTRLAGDFEEAGEEIIIASKALGLTGEGMAHLALSGRAHGKSLKKTLQDLKVQVVQVSKAFGVNEKLTGQMINQMAQAPEVFGTDTKEMLKMSVAAQKLGVSIETLTKATAVFDDFESGAKAAGELAAQFGITVDAMDMMTATPAEQVTMLKDALQASGQEFESMSRQEKARMAELTGMDMMELQNMMDPTNAFDMNAMDDVNDGVDAATRATMAQTAANRELVKVMERVIEQGEQLSGSGGLLGAFFDGVSKGIGKSEEFRHIILGIYETFKIVDRAGQRVGLMLGELFGKDGPLHVVTDFFDHMFNPTKMRKRMGRIEGFFRTFVDTVKGGGENVRFAFTDLFNAIFGEFFGGGGGGGSFVDTMLQGLEDAIDFVGASLITFAPTLFDGLAKLFQGALSLLTNGLKAPEVGAGLAEDGFMPMIQAALADPALATAWEGLATSFMAFIDKFWTDYGETITSALGKILGVILGAALLQSVGYIVAAGMIGGFVKNLMARLMGGLGAATPPSGAAMPMTDWEKQGPIGQMAQGIKCAVEHLSEINPGKLFKAAGILLLISGMFGLAVLGVIELAVHMESRGAKPMHMIAIAAVIYALAKMVGAVAGLMYAIKFAKGVTVQAMSAAALILGGIIILMYVIADVMVTTTEELSRIRNPVQPSTVEAAGDIIAVVLKTLGLLLGMTAVLTVIAVLASGPQVIFLLAVFAAAAAVMVGVVELLKELISSFSGVSLEESQKAGQAAATAGKIIEVLFRTIELLWDVIKGQRVDPDIFEKAAEELADVVSVMAKKIMPAIQAAADAITSNPAELREKIDIMVLVFQSFEPIANLMTAALQIKDLDPGKVAQVIQTVGAGMKSIFDNMGGLLTTIVTSAGGMSKQQIDSATAASGLMTAFAQLMGQFTLPESLLGNELRETVSKWGGGFLQKANTTTVIEVVKTQEEKIREYVGAMAFFMESFTKPEEGQTKAPLQRLIDGIMALEFGEQPAVLKAKTAGLIQIFEMIEAFGKAMGSIGGSGEFEQTTAWMALPITTMRLSQYFAEGCRGTGCVRNNIETAVIGMVGFYDSLRNTGAKTALPWVVEFMQLLANVMGPLETIGSFDLMTLTYPAEVLDAFIGLENSFAPGREQPLVDMIIMFGQLAELTEGYDFDGLEDLEDLINFMHPLQLALEDFGEYFDAAMFDPLRGILTELDDIGGIALSAFTGMEYIPLLMQEVDALVPQIDDWKKQVSYTMFDPVLDIIHSFNAIGEELSGADNIVNIVSRLRQIGKALKIADSDTVTVTRGDVNITVDMKVVMEASVLSQVLVQGQLVKKGLKYKPPINMEAPL